MKDDQQVKWYQKGDSIPKQAQRMWLILVAIAKLKPPDVYYTGGEGRTPGLVTYATLAELSGKPRQAARTQSRQLGIIGMYCKERKLPALNAIVINQGSGEPGEYVLLSISDDPKKEQEEVLKTEWFEIRPPTINLLRRVYERHPHLRYP